MTAHIESINPAGWPQPRGYSNGVVATGRALYIAGQIGWNENGEFPCADVVGQFGTALDNVLAVVHAGGGKATDICKMTVFVTDIPAYRASVRELGAVWRERMGKHYPAMALVGVTELVEPRALVEIEAVATLVEEST